MSRIPALVEAARGGDPRALARLITLVENDDEGLPELAALLAPHTGTAQVIGLTGSPGVGKSTTTNELVRALRARGHRVGVLAVDPSSPFTGGAIALGHPIGMSGARLVLTLALELKRRGGGLGAAALCGGGGQGDALLLRVPGV